jgi:hypothetical protein
VLVGDPVHVRSFAQLPDRRWLDPKSGVPLTVANFRELAEATFVLPRPLPAAVAVDVDLRLEVDSVRGSGLRLQQLCTVDTAGNLLPVRYARRDMTVTVDNSRVTITHRTPVELVGRHPLLTVTADQLRVDAEFLDVTELWWGLRATRSAPAPTRGDWYLHPALGGHPDRLRVLAATTPGKGPMLWAAWPSRAASTQPRSIRPLIFLIAPAWLNGGLGLAYELNPAGLATTARGEAAMSAIGRFLLSPVPSARLDAVRRATPRLPEIQLWQLAADVLMRTVPNVQGMPKGALWPEKLLEAKDGAATPRAVLPLDSDIGHRPASHEATADDKGEPLLLIYPLGPSEAASYESIGEPGLAERMTSLVHAMFNVGAVASTATAPPARDDLIMAGHSSGSIQMWAGLSANGADIARCIAFDAAGDAPPEKHKKKIKNGARLRRGKPFTLVLVTSPNSGSLANLATRVVTVREALRENPASTLVVLPAEPDQATFWDPRTVRPKGTPTKNPVLRAMLDGWPDPEVKSAADMIATKPGLWGFLFFHEFTAYGGQSPTRTFFRDALDA